MKCTVGDMSIELDDSAGGTYGGVHERQMDALQRFLDAAVKRGYPSPTTLPTPWVIGSPTCEVTADREVVSAYKEGVKP